MKTLLIDSREDPKRIRKVQSTIPHNQLTTISVGDYVWVEGGVPSNPQGTVPLVAVEWKTFPDLCSSISSGHMESQLRDMDQYDCPTFLFIVGTHTIPRHCPLTIEAVYGYLTSACIHHKIKILCFKTQPQAIRQLSRLPDKLGSPSSTAGLPQRHTHMDNPNDEMFLAVPGIGIKSLPKYRKYKFGEFIRLIKAGGDVGFKVPDRVRSYLMKL